MGLYALALVVEVALLWRGEDLGFHGKAEGLQ
jgi:hypothetical protein